jgi:uncharacterized coiled-coil DUF342 family protein
MKPKWLIICCITICLGVLGSALIIFTSNSSRLSEYFEGFLLVAAKPGNETIDIDTLKSIFEIQKQSVASDIMAFLYTFFSTVLVGIGMFILTRIQDNADKTKDKIDNSMDKLKYFESKLSDFHEKLKINTETMYDNVKESENKIEAIRQRSNDLLEKMNATHDSVKESKNKIADIEHRSDDLLEKMNATQVAFKEDRVKIETWSQDIKNSLLVSSTIQHLSIAEYYSFLLENFTTIQNDQAEDLIYKYIPKFRDKLKGLRNKLKEEKEQGNKLSTSELEIIHETLQSMVNRIQRYHINLPKIFNDALTEDLLDRCQKCINIMNDLS